MAAPARTALTTGSNKTTNTTVNSASVTLSAGDMLVVLFAGDTQATSVTWNSINLTKGSEYDYTGSVAASLWYLKVTSGTSAVVTMNYSSADAKAWAISKITNVTRFVNPGQENWYTGTANFWASAQNISNRRPDTIYYAALGVEGPSGDSTGTWANSWSAGQRSGTTGNPAAGNITIYEGYYIVSTLTGSYAQVDNITNRDSVIIGGFFDSGNEQFAQALADIKETTSAFAQALAQILKTETYSAVSQAQAQIITPATTVSVQAQADAYILGITRVIAQANAWILATTNAYSQAQTRIKTSNISYAQAQASVVYRYNQFAQARTKIHVETRVFGQAQALLNMGFKFGQAGTRIIPATIYYSVSDTFTRTVSPGWGTADIGGGWSFSDSSKFSTNGSQGIITNTTYTGLLAQLKATVPITNKYSWEFTYNLSALPTNEVYLLCRDAEDSGIGFGIYIQNDGTIYKYVYADSSGYGAGTPWTYVAGETWRVKIEAQRNSINSPDAYIKTWKDGTSEPDWVTISAGTSSTDPPAYFSFKFSAPNTTITIDDFKITQFQQRYGQAVALIDSPTKSNFAQAQAYIWTSTRQYAQAQSYIRTPIKQRAQAQALIVKPSQFGQAVADIKQTYPLSIIAPITFIQHLGHYNNSSTNSISISNINKTITYGNTVIVSISANGAPGVIDLFTSVTDNLGNTYSRVEQVGITQSTSASLYYAPINTGGTLTTITANFSRSGYNSINASEWSGINTLVEAGGGEFSSNATTIKWVSNKSIPAKGVAIGTAADWNNANFTAGSASGTPATSIYVEYSYPNGSQSIATLYSAIPSSNVTGFDGVANFGGSGTYIAGAGGIFSGKSAMGGGTFAQVQAFISTDKFSFAQAQAQIAGATETRVYSQAQADIQVTTNSYAQSLSAIKQIYNSYAQVQSHILVTQRSFAQGNAWISATTNAYAQAQATLIAPSTTINKWAQVNSLIGRIDDLYTAIDEAAADDTDYIVSLMGGEIYEVKLEDLGTPMWKRDHYIFVRAHRVSGSGYLVSQLYQGTTLIADVSNAYSTGDWKNVIGTLNTDHINSITDYSDLRIRFVPDSNSKFLVSQAYLQRPPAGATSYRGYAQAAAQILSTVVTREVYGQSQAHILRTESKFAQSVAQILRTERGYAQSAAHIKRVELGYAQASADIKSTYRGYAQANAAIKTTYNGYAQAQANIKQTYRGYAQAIADIEQAYQSYAQANATIKTSYRGYAQAIASIKQTYNGYAQSQAQILHTYQGYAQASVAIENIYNGYAQSAAWIVQAYRGFAQAQATIFATVNQWAQAQGQILGLATYNVYAQAQTSIEQTYTVYAQATTTIKTAYLGYAQATATIEQTYVQVAQAQANVKTYYRGYAQAQANIENTYNVYAQAQATLKQSYLGFAQASVVILATYRGYAQANAYTILAGLLAYSQAAAHIKTTTNAYAQAQAQILGQAVITNAHAQSTVWILTTYRGYAQAQASVLTTYRGYAQAGAHVEATYQGFAQAQAQIQTTYRGYAQTQAWIEQTYVVFAQAQTSILGTYLGHSQAVAHIKTTYRGFAQAQTSILVTGLNGYAQACATILQTYADIAQAQAHIKSTYLAYAQAQASILLVIEQYAQVQANILQTYQAYAQAFALIAGSYWAYAQVQAHIIGTSVVHAQAQAKIMVSSVVFAQAGAQIYTPQHIRLVADISNDGWRGVVI